jgi:uncharacterized protein
VSDGVVNIIPQNEFFGVSLKNLLPLPLEMSPLPSIGKRFLPFVFLLFLSVFLFAQTAFADDLAAIPPLDSPVVDTTNTLDAATKNALVSSALNLQKRNGSQLQILIVPTTKPESIEDYSQRVFDAWKLGQKGVDNGVLLVVAMNDHRVRIQTGYGEETRIPDATAKEIIEERIVPEFRVSDYSKGIDDADKALVALMSGEKPSSVSMSHGDPSIFFWVAAPCGISFLLGILLSILFPGRFENAKDHLRAGLFYGMFICFIVMFAMVILKDLVWGKRLAETGALVWILALFFDPLGICKKEIESANSLSPGISSDDFFLGRGGGGGSGDGGGGGWGGGGGDSGGGGASGGW